MILRLCNIILLLIWVIFLGWLLTYGSGDLIRLLHPRLWWVLGLATVVLILFLGSLIISLRQKGSGNASFLELPGILILLIPCLYFFIAKEARLDATSLHNRIIQNDDGIFINNLPSFDVFNGPDSDVVSFSRILQEPKKFENQDVEVVCQSFVHDDLPENTAMCYRYMITCCAADALPAFIFLNHEGEIKNNRWMKVNGQLSIIRRSDMEFPSIEVSNLEYVKEPAFPWAM